MMLRALVLGMAFFFATAATRAEDDVLLVQTGPEGFRVWHTEGPSRLSDDEAIVLMASARPEGGPLTMTRLGMAHAHELPGERGIVIQLLSVERDKSLLVDRDACGHVHLWHAEGSTHLSEAEITEIIVSALPDGGPRITLGDRYAKGVVTPLGIMVMLWKKPITKPGAPP